MKYCTKCKIKTEHKNRMCQICFKINNNSVEKQIIKDRVFSQEVKNGR